jgi:hypothetical protein
MKKEELVHLHLLLAQLKKYFEENGFDSDFDRYKRLDISPFQVHRSKGEHKQAIFTLGDELVSIIAKNQFLERQEVLEA